MGNSKMKTRNSVKNSVDVCGVDQSTVLAENIFVRYRMEAQALAVNNHSEITKHVHRNAVGFDVSANSENRRQPELSSLQVRQCRAV